MELIWSNDGVSTLLLLAKILLFPEEKENLCKKITKDKSVSFFSLNTEVTKETEVFVYSVFSVFRKKIMRY